MTGLSDPIVISRWKGRGVYGVIAAKRLFNNAIYRSLQEVAGAGILPQAAENRTLVTVNYTRALNIS